MALTKQQRNSIPTRRRAGRARVGLAEAADHADVSIRTLRRRIADGSLPAYRVGPRLIKVELADVDKLARRIPTADGKCA